MQIQNWEPLGDDIRHARAEADAEARAADIDRTAERVAAAPSPAQLAEAIAYVGTLPGALERLHAAYMASHEFFVVELVAQIDDGFLALAEAEVAALDCDASGDTLRDF